MKTLTVNQVHKKTITYEKYGEQKSFEKFAIKSGVQWYTLEGFGKKDITENDVVSGILSEKHYTKNDGSQGVEQIFKLLSPEVAELYLRVEALEMYMNSNNGVAQIKTEPAQPEGEEDLPF